MFECREVLQLSDYALGPRWWCNSLGVVLDTPWGTTPPYAGVAVTDYYVYYGCGQAYWCCEYYGIPRWVTLSSYFGVSADLAYGIICSYDPCWRVDRVPAGPGDRPADEPTTWSMLKTLYR
jgi:hypothetical protein